MLSPPLKSFYPKCYFYCYFKGQAKFGFLRELISVEHVRGPLPPSLPPSLVFFLPPSLPPSLLTVRTV